MNEIAIYPSLKDKVVIITGGAQGIGESIVEQLFRREFFLRKKLKNNNKITWHSSTLPICFDLSFVL